MIVPMTKYDFVLFRDRKEEFLDRLQELGLVDITSTGWEPDEGQRSLIASIEKHHQAAARLREIAREPGYKPGKKFADGEEAWEHYLEASAQEESIAARMQQLEKELQELRVWGEFDPAHLRELEASGLRIRFYSAPTREFEAARPKLEEHFDVVAVGVREGMTHFVVVDSAALHQHEATESAADQSARRSPEELIDAQERGMPTVDFRQKERELKELQHERKRWRDELRRSAASAEAIERHGTELTDRLHLSRAMSSHTDEAEGTLIIMEGWATRESAARLDEFLASQPEMVYLKSDPTPEDETPVLLKNGKFSRMFEIIGNFYSLPKYGTLDLTSFFGPFYALFFGFCLADAGYGLLYIVAGIVMRLKLKPEMHGIANLVITLGAATVICGVLMDSFFGMNLTSFAPLAGLHAWVIDPNSMFYVALGLGLVQILYAMMIKVVSYARRFGIMYALAPLGWLIAVACTVPYLAGMLGVHLYSGPIPKFHVVGILVGLFMMLFLNSPGKNPLTNLGKGIWNTYNDVTGFLSDFLSYIRLFAIGLSGGILASIFNQLAFGLSPDIPVLKQLFVVVILLIGHGLNLFMGSISSFVHPMRLTFVEFYKNSGFEDTQRAFTPLKKSKK